MNFITATPLLVCLLWMSLTGCTPSSANSQDEQRDAYYLTGKNRVKALDYQGAIEAFEKAVELNPRSASAHFELGILKEQRANDYAAAIYHYERFLALRPQSEYAETVRQLITACKQEIARSVTMAPVTQSIQRDFERLTAENFQLQQQVAQLQKLLAQRAPLTNGPTIAAAPKAPLVIVSEVKSAPAPSRVPPPSPPPAPVQAPAARSHVIKNGDTPYSIARKYGIGVDSLLAANPSLDPKRLKVGQTLKIPAP